MANNKLEKFRHLKSRLLSGGDQNVINELRKKEKLTARERINVLFDDGTFVEVDAFMKGSGEVEAQGEGVITGYGLIDGKLVYAYSQDYSVLAGSIGEVHSKKIVRVQEMALKMGAPIVGLKDSGGARIQEGINALAGYANIIRQNTLASGVIPQIIGIMGSSVGGDVYTPALSDFVFMVDKTSQMFVTGPKLIQTVTGEDVTVEEIGGAMAHNSKSGAAHFIANTDVECIDGIRDLISLLPSNNMEGSPIQQSNDDVNRTIPEFENIIPESTVDNYEMKEIVKTISDESYFYEVQRYYAENIITGFVKINGQTVGVVANQPNVLNGSLDIKSSHKGARFVRFCDSFSIPLLTLVDVPGFLPGVDQELGGLIRDGGKLLYAYAEATVPKVTLVVRKAYGVGYVTMCSKNLGADMVFAWPNAQIAVMRPEGAANILFKEDIAEADDPKSLRNQKVEEYLNEFATPYKAAEMGYVDDVIEPSATRPRVVDAFNMLMSKRDNRPSKKHGNIPL